MSTVASSSPPSVYFIFTTIALCEYTLSPDQTIATCQRNISQHCWRNMLRAFGHHVASCCGMLGVVGSNLTIFKLEPTTRRNMVAKRAQHVTPNNVAISCVDMLRSFGWGFKRLGNAVADFINSWFRPIDLISLDTAYN